MPRYIDAEVMPNDAFWSDLTDREKAKVLQWLVSAPTADIVSRAEFDLYNRLYHEVEDELASVYDRLEKTTTEIATKIIEEIEACIAVHAFTSKSEDYAEGCYDTIEWVDSKIDELRKKYTGANDE